MHVLITGHEQVWVSILLVCRTFAITLIIIYFENVHFFHANLGLDVFTHMKSPHTSLNTAHLECKPSTFMSSSTYSFQVLLFILLHLTHATSTFLQADTQSSTLMLQMSKPPQFCHASPHPPHSVLPKNCTNPHCIFYPSATPRTSISPHPLRPLQTDNADFLSSLLRFQSHMSTHSGHNPCIFFFYVV